MSGRDGIVGVIDGCIEDMIRVESVWPGENDEERKEMRATLGSIMLRLEPVIRGRDVSWRLLREARNLVGHASHNLRRLRLAEYSRKLSSLERRLRAQTTDDGWDAYLQIETLKSDEARRRCAPR